MKISKKALIAVVATLPMMFGSLTSCGASDSQTIEVVFVPSRDATALGKSAAALEPILDKIMEDNGYKYNFKITTSTDYAAATTALLSGTADIAFLTGTAYAQATVDYAGKVDLLLTARRDGYKVQTVDFPNTDNSEEGRHRQCQAMNGEIAKDGETSNYVYRGEQDSTNPADSYNSILISNRNHKENGVATEIKYIDDLIGKTVGIQSTTSGAGYNYPKMFLKSLSDEATRTLWFRPNSEYLNNDYIKEHGLTIVTGEPDASKGEIKGVQISGYDAAFTEVMNENSQFAGVWGFNDIRYSNGYNKTNGEYKGNESVFTNTYTVCMTKGIYNDTISARADLSDDAKNAVKLAFKTAVTMGSKTDGESAAGVIYNIYSHTGYVDGVDANYEAERTIYTENKASN